MTRDLDTPLVITLGVVKPARAWYRDEGTWFRCLIPIVYMHGTMHVAYACE